MFTMCRNVILETHTHTLHMCPVCHLVLCKDESKRSLMLRQVISCPAFCRILTRFHLISSAAYSFYLNPSVCSPVVFKNVTVQCLKL